MFFFFHLFAGIVFRLLIADLLHDRRWAIPFAIGAVLPDLIDKPIGYVFFADIFGNGRIFMHSLLLFCVILIIGLVIWKCWTNPAGLALALGILSHQVLDIMWEAPKTWYFPLLGRFDYTHRVDYAFVLLQRDMSARSEWVLAAVIGAAIILFLAFRRKQGIISKYRVVLAWLMGAGALISVVFAGVAIGAGLFAEKRFLLRSFRFFGWTGPVECMIGGLVFLACAVLIWRMRSDLLKGEAIISEKE